MSKKQTAYFDEIEVGEGQHFTLWMKSEGKEKVKALEVNENGELIVGSVKSKMVLLKEDSIEASLDAKSRAIDALKETLILQKKEDERMNATIISLEKNASEKFGKFDSQLQEKHRELQALSESIQRLEKDLSSKLKIATDTLGLRISRTHDRLLHFAEYLCNHLKLNLSEALFGIQSLSIDGSTDRTLEIDLKDASNSHSSELI